MAKATKQACQGEEHIMCGSLENVRSPIRHGMTSSGGQTRYLVLIFSPNGGGTAFLRRVQFAETPVIHRVGGVLRTRFGPNVF